MTGRNAGDRELFVGDVSLQTFKGRIDTILAGLKGSSADPAVIGDQTITPEAFGTGFSAAEDLAVQYEKVLTRLETLSRIFGEQVEAVGLTVDIADKGYGGVDVDQAARLQAIHTHTSKHYRPPADAQGGGHGGAEAERGDGKSGGSEGL